MSIYDIDCELGCKLLKAERNKLEAIKKHYDNRPKVVHAPLWFMKLGKILEAEV